MKKKVYPGLIEADKEECAIVVHYETSEPPSTERTRHTRRLRLKTLNARSGAREGCFTVTSNSESLSDQCCPKTHSPCEALKRDDHLGPNRMSL